MNVLKITNALKNPKLKSTVFSISLLSCGALLFQNCSAKPVNTAAYSSNGTPTAVTCSITFTDTNFTQTLALYSTVTAFDTSGASLVRTCTKNYSGAGVLDGASTFSLQFAPAAPAVVGTHTVAAGRDFSCAIIHGLNKCWGYGLHGELGNNMTNTLPAPGVIANFDGKVFSDISSGSYHTCAVYSGGVWCWGHNGQGQIVNGGTLIDSLIPKPITGLGSGVTRVATGSRASCAIQNGALFCWGQTANGQVGVVQSNGFVFPNLSSPQQVFASGITDVDTGGWINNGGGHTCAIKDGALYCWGYNNYGQLGDGTVIEKLTPPAIVPQSLKSGVTQVSTGGQHTCAIVSGDLYCWGRNVEGQLAQVADGGSHTSPTKVSIPNNLKVLSVTTGEASTCVIAEGNLAYCWGYNGDGRLGIGNNTTPIITPTPVMLLASEKVVEITAGEIHTCLRILDGTVKCFGEGSSYKLGNVNALGNFAGATSNIPVPVFGQ